jgi:putative DNA methylase
MSQSLIEQWFPAATVGAESLRERATFTALPAPFAIHVWWARRPLITSRAAVIASLLPAWPSDSEVSASEEVKRLADALTVEFPMGEAQYHSWFRRALGITGAPVAARAAIAAARAAGRKTVGNAYGYDRAFTVSPDAETVARVQRLASLRGLAAPPIVLDPFAGGGSIPFEAARYGCDTIANELNPVAAAVLHGTVVLPGELGLGFVKVLEEWAGRWIASVRDRLADFFHHSHPDERNAYVWAHTVPCPTTGRPTPLVPSLWLATGGSGRSVAMKLDPDHASGDVRLSIVEGPEARRYGDAATYSGGTATSIWDKAATISSEEIKREARAGRMGQMLLAVSSTRPGVPGRQFRAPSAADQQAVVRSLAELERRLPEWDIDGLVPDEPVVEGKETERSVDMGVDHWRKMFSPRQLLSNVTAMKEMRSLLAEARGSMSDREWRGLGLYLALALDKAIDYNSAFASWESDRVKVAHTFDRHDFAFKWTFAELDGAGSLLPWAVDQIVSTYRGTAKLATRPETLTAAEHSASARVIVGSAAQIDAPDGSVDVIVTDPPYYDNVMYGECSDFFYVWLKRSLRDTWPELTRLSLTDKENEAVANPSLFRDVATHVGRGRRKPGTVTAAELADGQYEQLLMRSFREASRVLKDSGTMTVMFTHKRVDAWDTLGAALLEAGFEIVSSWPVHTEAEHSLHQAKKNSASSTILLACRKRASVEPAYWADIRAHVESGAEDAAKRFSAEGIKGVDLTLATYGPALSVLSRNWPVYTGNLTADGEREKLRPDAALDLARQRVALLKKRDLLGGRDVEFDRATDWWLLAWNDFQAAQFPAGEALKLCIAMDLDLDDVAKQHKLVKAASGDVTLLTPAQRRTAKSLDPDVGTWSTLIDALHALMLTYDEEGLAASRAWLTRTGKRDDERFGAVVEAAVHAVPRTRDKDREFTRPEARILESRRATLFDWIEAPTEPESAEAPTLDFVEG